MGPALVNTLSPGDQVLTFDTGQFAVLWGNMAHKLGLDVADAGDRLAPRRRAGERSKPC